eukprot:363910-Chlamydomonas_euryale.AAC.3
MVAAVVVAAMADAAALVAAALVAHAAALVAAALVAHAARARPHTHTLAKGFCSQSARRQAC